jgi:hypothetical protein
LIYKDEKIILNKEMKTNSLRRIFVILVVFAIVLVHAEDTVPSAISLEEAMRLSNENENSEFSLRFLGGSREYIVQTGPLKNPGVCPGREKLPEGTPCLPPGWDDCYCGDGQWCPYGFCLVYN